MTSHEIINELVESSYNDHPPLVYKTLFDFYMKAKKALPELQAALRYETIDRIVRAETLSTPRPEVPPVEFLDGYYIQAKVRQNSFGLDHGQPEWIWTWTVSWMAKDEYKGMVREYFSDRETCEKFIEWHRRETEKRSSLALASYASDKQAGFEVEE
jgi:hypothetical protein